MIINSAGLRTSIKPKTRRYYNNKRSAYNNISFIEKNKNTHTFLSEFRVWQRNNRSLFLIFIIFIIFDR